MFLTRLLLGFVLILLGLGYLYQPKSILRFNAFMRETLFKDTHVLLNPKRVGLWLLVPGLILCILTLGMP